MRWGTHTAALCTVVLPWGKYEYIKLPMGLCHSPYIFQKKMGDILVDLESVGPRISRV